LGGDANPFQQLKSIDHRSIWLIVDLDALAGCGQKKDAVQFEHVTAYFAKIERLRWGQFLVDFLP
jgi:hypothetical protein